MVLWPQWSKRGLIPIYDVCQQLHSSYLSIFTDTWHPLMLSSLTCVVFNDSESRHRQMRAHPGVLQSTVDMWAVCRRALFSPVWLTLSLQCSDSVFICPCIRVSVRMCTCVCICAHVRLQTSVQRPCIDEYVLTGLRHIAGLSRGSPNQTTHLWSTHGFIHTQTLTLLYLRTCEDPLWHKAFHHNLNHYNYMHTPCLTLKE